MQAHACMVSHILNLLFVHMYDLYIQEHMESQVHTGQRCTYGHTGAHMDSQMHTWLTGAHMDMCTNRHRFMHTTMYSHTVISQPTCAHVYIHERVCTHSLSHSLTPVLPLGEYCWQFWYLKPQASCSGGAETGQAGESRLKQGLLWLRSFRTLCVELVCLSMFLACGVAIFWGLLLKGSSCLTLAPEG